MREIGTACFYGPSVPCLSMKQRAVGALWSHKAMTALIYAVWTTLGTLVLMMMKRIRLNWHVLSLVFWLSPFSMSRLSNVE